MRPLVDLALTAAAGGMDKSIGVRDDALPWEWILVGAPTVLLALLVALALHRQRQRSGRP